MDDALFIMQQSIHKLSEAKPDSVVGMAIGLENERVAEDGFQNFAAAGEAELLVEFTGVIEGEDLEGLFGEIVFGLVEESEMIVSEEDVLEIGNEVR